MVTLWAAVDVAEINGKTKQQAASWETRGAFRAEPLCFRARHPDGGIRKGDAAQTLGPPIVTFGGGRARLGLPIEAGALQGMNKYRTTAGGWRLLKGVAVEDGDGRWLYRAQGRATL